MRLPDWPQLPAKEFRELFAARAFWLLLLIVGLLAGHGFITAVRLYTEMSGSGGPAALPQGLSPLDGVLVPAWGAYDLAATLLFPFVAIRMISAEKESGALKLLLGHFCAARRVGAGLCGSYGECRESRDRDARIHSRNVGAA